jgi:hypothetical protein
MNKKASVLNRGAAFPVVGGTLVIPLVILPTRVMLVGWCNAYHALSSPEISKQIHDLPMNAPGLADHKTSRLFHVTKLSWT